jgi:propionyl-CoA synthetase
MLHSFVTSGLKGSPGLGNMVGYGRVPVRYGSCSLPVCGYDVQIFDEDGKKLPANSLGNMVIKTPLPPGTMQTIFNDDERFVSGYLSRFPGYFETGDAAFKDEDG